FGTQIRKALLGDGHLPQRVEAMRIESCRDEHQLGPKRLGDRPQDLRECETQIGIGRPGGEGHVDGSTYALATTLMMERPRPRIEGELMRGEKQDIRVRGKDRLRAIAMMHIPIDDQYPLY